MNEKIWLINEFCLCSEKGETAWAMSCISEAVKADPNDIRLKYHLASLYLELGNYQRAADSYRQIVQFSPEDVDALKKAAKVLPLS